MRLSIVLVAGLLVAGCMCPAPGPGGDGPVIAEGVIWYVQYETVNGETSGLTRANQAGAVPGGSGAFNVDAYGRLTPQFLIVTYPQRKDLGPLVIPANRLVAIQFGDGGVKTVPQ